MQAEIHDAVPQMARGSVPLDCANAKRYAGRLEHAYYEALLTIRRADRRLAVAQSILEEMPLSREREVAVGELKVAREVLEL